MAEAQKRRRVNQPREVRVVDRGSRAGGTETLQRRQPAQPLDVRKYNRRDAIVDPVRRSGRSAYCGERRTCGAATGVIGGRIDAGPAALSVALPSADASMPFCANRPPLTRLSSTIALSRSVCAWSFAAFLIGDVELALEHEERRRRPAWKRRCSPNNTRCAARAPTVPRAPVLRFAQTLDRVDGLAAEALHQHGLVDLNLALLFLRDRDVGFAGMLADRDRERHCAL